MSANHFWLGYLAAVVSSVEFQQQFETHQWCQDPVSPKKHYMPRNIWGEPKSMGWIKSFGWCRDLDFIACSKMFPFECAGRFYLYTSRYFLIFGLFNPIISSKAHFPKIKLQAWQHYPPGKLTWLAETSTNFMKIAISYWKVTPPLKINGWFRCIFYEIVPKNRGHVSFQNFVFFSSLLTHKKIFLLSMKSWLFYRDLYIWYNIMMYHNPHISQPCEGFRECFKHTFDRPLDH